MGVVVVNTPGVVLYDAAGVAMAVSDGVAIPLGTSGLIIAGSDGTDSRFIKVTSDGSVRTRPWDGTNSQPAMDAAARAGFQKITDGTNLLPTADVAARALFAKVTDGTNVLPTMDAIGRAGFQKITDGTSLLTIKPASTASVAADPSAVVALSPNSPLPAGTNTLGKADQGAPNTAANYWPVRHTDGTNFLPTADAVGRALFAKVTDGSNTMPTMDAVGRPGFQKITDGTNVAAVKAASTAVAAADPALAVSLSPNSPLPAGTNTLGKADQGAANTAANRWPIYLTNGTQNMPTMDAAARAGFFQQTDGTNIAPTMDAAARAGFVKLTDGTNTAAVKAASTAPVAADPAEVVVISPNQQAIPVTNSPSGATTGIAYGEVTTTATANVPVRKTTYTEQSSNAQRSISSSSASDTNAAGTGARQVKITYYDSTGAGPNTETVNLNGTTAVNTVSTTICFIEKIEVVSVGSNGSNVGTISLFVSTGGGGGTIGTITAGDNRTLWAHHYVASGKSCYITGMTGNNTSSSNSTLFNLRAKDPTNATAVEQLVSDTLTDGGGLAQTERAYSTPIKVVGPARVILYGAPAGTPSITSRGSFDFYDQ